MRKYHIGEDENTNNESYEYSKTPKSVDDLRRRVADMSVLADIQSIGHKALVRVQAHAGTSQYMASGGEDHFWLNKFCYNKKVSGPYTLYYFRFDREVLWLY